MNEHEQGTSAPLASPSTSKSPTQQNHDISSSSSLLPPSPLPATHLSPTSSPPTTTADDMRGMSVFCAPKAGMAAVDTARVNSVVFAMSKDSLHFRHQQQLASNTARRIQTIQRRITTLRNEPPSYLAHLNSRASDLLLSYEQQRDMSHMWLHIDLDSFYAAVHLSEPAYAHLRDKPVAVGSMSMICTSNYVARQYGVRSAMPGFIAVKLCPQLFFIPTNFPKYKAIATVFRAIFAQYDPNFESASLDEAYLDITAHLATKQSQHPLDQLWDRDTEAGVVAAEIRQRVFESTQLTCSAGIACNRMLAKIATDVNKPNGQHLVPSTLPAILDFISPLPVRKVPGIGKVLERTLNAIGVTSVGQMRDDEYRPLLVDCFSELTYGWLFRVALGLGRVEHEKEDERRRKSVSTERTFRDLSSYAELTGKLDEIARSLFSDLERLGVKGRTLTLKLKTAAFEVKQHSVSVEKGLWIHKLDDLRRLGLQLLREELNLLLTGKKVKRAAQKEASLSNGAAAVAAPVVGLFTGSGKVAVGSPFDGLMRIRLMGLRLSGLYVDETDQMDEEAGGEDGVEQSAGGGSVKKRGGMSILKFTKRVEQDEAIVDESSSITVEQQQSSKRRRTEADNSDISKYFDVTSPTKAPTSQSSTETTELVRTKSSGSRRNIESYFSQSASLGSVDGENSAEDDDVLVDDDRAADEWMELLQDAADSTADHQSNLSDVSHSVVPPVPIASLDLPTIAQQDSQSATISLSLRTNSTGSPPVPITSTAPQYSPPASVAVVVLCPVCGAELGGTDGRAVSNFALNQHIDACLRNANSCQPTSRTTSHKPAKASLTTSIRTAVSSVGGRKDGRRGSSTGSQQQQQHHVSLKDMWKKKGG